MPRRPEPWYWKARSCWYVQIDKKQVKLDPNKKVAMQLWHRLMADEGLLTKEEKRALTVGEALDLFLDSRAGRRELTIEKYEKYLIPLAKEFDSKKLAEVRPLDVIAYGTQKTGWQDGTRRGVFSMMMTLMRWARDVGYIDLNPMAGVANPWPPSQNRRAMTAVEYRTLLGGINDSELRLIVRVLWSTGCRPSEAYNLKARHLHPLQPVATLQPSEHKTGGRTGRCRYIIFPRGLMEEVRKQAAAHPEGVIFLNTRGRPWTVFNVCKRFSIYRSKLGLDSGVVPYATRHALATNLVASNPDTSPILLAKILGHANANTFQSVYYHPDMQKMIDIVDAEDGRGAPIESPDPNGEASGS